MEIIKITPGMLFLLEHDGTMPEAQSKYLIEHWEKVMPNNKLMLVKRGSMKILDTTEDK